MILLWLYKILILEKKLDEESMRNSYTIFATFWKSKIKNNFKLINTIYSEHYYGLGFIKLYFPVI